MVQAHNGGAERLEECGMLKHVMCIFAEEQSCKTVMAYVRFSVDLTKYSSLDLQKAAHSAQHHPHKGYEKAFP